MDRFRLGPITMIILVSEIIFNNNNFRDINRGYQGVGLYAKTCETKILKLDWKKRE